MHSSTLCSRWPTRDAHARSFVLGLFIVLVISVRPIISTDYRSDLCEISRIGRTLAVRSEVIFLDPSRDVAASTNFIGKIDLHCRPCSSHDIR